MVTIQFINCVLPQATEFLNHAKAIDESRERVVVDRMDRKDAKERKMDEKKAARGGRGGRGGDRGRGGRGGGRGGDRGRRGRGGGVVRGRSNLSDSDEEDPRKELKAEKVRQHIFVQSWIHIRIPSGYPDIIRICMSSHLYNIFTRIYTSIGTLV
jgi:hypothetical protein